MNFDAPLAIIGGGISGASLSYAFAKRKLEHLLFESMPELAQKASGNPKAVVYPLITAEKTELSEFSLKAFEFFISEFNQDTSFEACGVLQLAYNDQKLRRYQKAKRNGCFPDHIVQFLSPAETKAFLPSNAKEAIFFEKAGWVNARNFCKSLAFSAQKIPHEPVYKIHKEKSAWMIHTQNKNYRVKSIFLANAYEALSLSSIPLRLGRIRGQICEFSSTEIPDFKPVICGDGYLIPKDQKNACFLVGGTYDRDNLDERVRPEDKEELKEKALDILGFSPQIEWQSSRASIRCTTPNHLPLIEEIEENLFVLVGMGSRGFLYAPYAAEITAQMSLSKSGNL